MFSCEVYDKHVDQVYIGWSNSSYTRIDWTTRKFLYETWGELQWDIETCGGKAPARDMVYGFLLLPCSPKFSKESKEDAFARFCKAQWKGSQMPALETLKQLKKADILQSECWIVLIRIPRPVGSKHAIPFSRRNDVIRLQTEYEEGNETAAVELAAIKAKCLLESHPTEMPLYSTVNGVLVQGVHANHFCTSCGAKGHHSAASHDSIRDPLYTSVQTHWPSWMNVGPVPQEVLAVPTTHDDKGFELHIRDTSAKIPLRLARAMKLHGTKIDGDVYMCGVQK